MGAFKLGKMTFGSLFKKPETIMYPIEQKPQPKGLKGRIAIDVEACILCGICERSCTTNCIKVDKQARAWTIDRLQCVQCGYCITVCPKKCLSMDPNYAPASIVHAVDAFEVPVQEKPATKSAAVKTKLALGDEPAKAAESIPDGQTAGDAMRGFARGYADKQLEALIGLLDSEKAGKVKAAFGK